VKEHDHYQTVSKKPLTVYQLLISELETYDVLLEGFGNEGRVEEAKNNFFEFL